MQIKFTIGDVFKNTFSFIMPVMLFTSAPMISIAMIAGAVVQKKFFYADKNGNDKVSWLFSDENDGLTLSPESEDAFNSGLLPTLLTTAVISYFELFTPALNFMFFFNMGISFLSDKLGTEIDQEFKDEKYSFSF